jgi:Domain of unknown function (DUF4421)
MGVFKNYVVLLFFFFYGLAIFAQEDTIKHQSKLNSSYIRDYKKMLTVRSYLLYEGIGFQIKPSGLSHSINYLPNIQSKVGVAAFYKWFGLGLAVNNPFTLPDNGNRGNSSIIDLRVNAYGKAIACEVSYQDYNGFYVSNSGRFISGWKPGDAFYQRPDMEIQAFSVQLYYLFNSSKHSIRAAYVQNEQQLKSSGALVLLPSFLYTDVKADSNLLPKEYLEDFEPESKDNIIKGKFYNYGFSVGYSYTLVFCKNFYLNMSIIPGVFLQSSDYSNAEASYDEMKVAILWLGRGAFGYSNRRFFAGAGGVFGYNSTPLPIGQTNFNFDMNQFRVWAGWRFNLKK